MNTNLNYLHPYPFEKLATLKSTCKPPSGLSHINLSIGEPQHMPPDIIQQALIEALPTGLGKYPDSRGLPELRQAIADWLVRRFQLPTDSIHPDQHILPVSGTREGLFSFAQAVIDHEAPRPLVLMPNPFYQIYEGAAYLANAQPFFLNCDPVSGQPDFDAVPDITWICCQLLYLCSPGNPSGTLIPVEILKKLIKKAEKYHFIIVADECYSELYDDEQQPPPGLLQVCAEMGYTDYRNCMVFHSLSKRSSVPGLRSGFIAGDKTILSRYLLYRTYHGCAMPIQTQMASIAAWQDETHVQKNRHQYRQKYDAVMDILAPVLKVSRPPASFYLWPETPIDDENFTRELFCQQHVSVIPGSYLSRQAEGINPGQNHVRIALVPPFDECVEAARRIADFARHL